METVPYTYFIKWSTLNLMYYGVKYAEGCHPDDFWVVYFTSSKLVQKCRNKYGEPEICKVSKRFTTKEAAVMHEMRFLKRVNAMNHPKFLNRSNGNGRCDSSNPEIRQKISESMKGENNHMFGKKHTIKSKKKMSRANLGKKNPMYGRTHTDEVKERLKQANLGMSNPAYGKTWVNDGNAQKMIDLMTEEMPSGYSTGRLKYKKKK